ncbi:endonuclease VII domain-containing protein [Thiothrix sp.]|uniref:endonuclease VII domain-containing protein n=1 Tax=Thiothrix sp. TaxID=1032 RepID=UPI00342DCB93
MKTCSKCKATKPKTDFSPLKEGRFGLHSWCKECVKEANRDRNKTAAGKAARRNQKLKANFKITLDDYNRMLEEQQFSCALCGANEPRGKGTFHVDHSHETLKVRGLLCHKCNVGLGCFNDDPQELLKGVAYLVRTQPCPTIDQ